MQSAYLKDIWQACIKVRKSGSIQNAFLGALYPIEGSHRQPQLSSRDDQPNEEGAQ